MGKTLPDAQLKSHGNANVEINSLKGKIKIISVVPQLNTPVCDKQTHQFSETNNGLDQHIDIITVSTNSPEGQYEFAKKRLSQYEGIAEVRIQDYREITGEYSQIVSIEMFEALGEKYWKKYFKMLFSILKPGGKLIIQSITINNNDFFCFEFMMTS